MKRRIFWKTTASILLSLGINPVFALSNTSNKVLLGEIFVKGYETSVNELLKENGHAYEYDGGKKKVFGE